MKYHILGLASAVVPYNSLLCRHTDPAQITHGLDEFMCGPFVGSLPDPLINGYKAIIFDTLEDAAAKIQTELAANSNYQYAIHIRA